MKRIKYIIIMAAVLVTAVCFMITFSRKNQAGKPDQVSEASFVFADKAAVSYTHLTLPTTERV